MYNAIIAKNPAFAEAMKYDSSGNEIDTSGDDWYATALEAFWDKIESDREELQDLYDSVNEGQIKLEELQQE